METVLAGNSKRIAEGTGLHQLLSPTPSSSTPFFPLPFLHFHLADECPFHVALPEQIGTGDVLRPSEEMRSPHFVPRIIQGKKN